MATSLAQGATNFITAQAFPVTNRFEAYAQVEPVAVLPVRGAHAGVLKGFEILPGARVRAGQKLGEIGGPQVEALLVQGEAALRSARTNLQSAQTVLEIERHQVTVHLSTRQGILQAQTDVAQAQARLDTAQAQLMSLRGLLTVASPSDGIVLAVDAANGGWLTAGQTILTVQPANTLWLKAAFYGAEATAVQVGMAGEFIRNNAGQAIPVRVSSIFGALGRDAGESVGLVPLTPSPGWLNGEFGTVILNSIARSLVAVPTRALVLDQGKWWVLVQTDKGVRSRAVVPGPTRGWQTFIESGLEAGTQVMVENAYLEFHRGISKSYQPPE